MTEQTKEWLWRSTQTVICALLLVEMYHQGVPKAYETLALIAVIWGTMTAQEREWIPKGDGYFILATALGLITGAIALSYFGV